LAAASDLSSASADAARDLYERYRGPIFAFCLSRLRSREEAEDATQTTFMNAFSGLQRGIVPEVEAAWLYTIAQNVCLTRRRSSWRRGRVETPGDLQALQDVVAAPPRPETDELMEVRAALEEMPASQRTAILLREWQGLSYREIAEHMATSEGAVETLIFRARRSLAKGLRKVRHALDAGALVAALKGLLAGGAAAKVAVTVAAVTTAAVIGATAIDRPGADARPLNKPPAELEPSTAIAGLPERVERAVTVLPEPSVVARAFRPVTRPQPKPRASVGKAERAKPRRAAARPKAKTKVVRPVPSIPPATPPEPAVSPVAKRHERPAKREVPPKAEAQTPRSKPKSAQAKSGARGSKSSAPAAAAPPKAKAAPPADRDVSEEHGKSEDKGKAKA
jgi:RNA polymerase sigma-70 factor, ECF subfamily